MAQNTMAGGKLIAKWFSLISIKRLIEEIKTDSDKLYSKTCKVAKWEKVLKKQ